MNVVDTVSQAGTSADVIAKVQQQAFLLSCLRKAKLDVELLDDIAEACDMNEFTALSLGSGELSVKSTADRLFLMEDEAASLIATCKDQCGRAGVNFGDGATYGPPNDDEEVSATPPAPAEPAKPAPAAAAPASASNSFSGPAAAPSGRGIYDHEMDLPDDDDSQEEGPLAPASSSVSMVPPSAAAAPAAIAAAARALTAALQPPPQQEPAAAAATPPPALAATAAAPKAAAATATVTPPPVRSAIPRPATASSHTPTSSATSAATPAASKATPAPSASTTPSSATAPRRTIRPATATTPSGGDAAAAAAATAAITGAHAGSSPSKVTARPASAGRPASASKVSTGTAAANATGAAAAGKLAGQTAAGGTTAAPKRRPQSAMPPTSSSPAVATPRYARATASAKARHTADEETTPGGDAALASIDSHSTPLPLTGIPSSAPPGGRRVADIATPPPVSNGGLDGPQHADTSPRIADRKKRTMFAHISSSLLRPTKAFLAWTSGNQRGADGSRAASETSETPPSTGPARSHYQVPTRESMATTSSGRKPSSMTHDGTPAGTPEAGGTAGKPPKTPHSSTRFQPFNLTEGRKNVGLSLTTEELQLAKAQEQGAFKARPMPKFMKRKTPAKDEGLAPTLDVAKAAEPTSAVEAPPTPTPQATQAADPTVAQ